MPGRPETGSTSQAASTQTLLRTLPSKSTDVAEKTTLTFFSRPFTAASSDVKISSDLTIVDRVLPRRSGVERLFTLKQAADLLAVSPELLKKLRRQGRLRVVRLGRSVRVGEKELERLSVRGSQD